MGEAKRRGPLAVRVAEAEAKKLLERAKFPDTVVCNNCQAELTHIEPFDVSEMPGMELAGLAPCSACDHSTWILDGDPTGMAMFQAFLNEHHGSNAVTTGKVLKPTAR